MATVDDYISRLAWFSSRPNWKLFEPSDSFYSRLLSGEDSDLCEATKALSDHIEIPPLGAVSYEWSLKMPASVAGRIHIRAANESRIQIPLFYVGKPLPLGAILAPELSHQLLAVHGISCSEEAENEQLTDAVSIVSGLGKVVLNGTITELAEATGETQLLGYLNPSMRIDLYNRVNVLHNISADTATKHLTNDAMDLFRRHRRN